MSTNTKVKRLSTVLEAISSFDLTQDASWSALDILATRVYLEAIEADPESIVIKGKQFSIAMNVYVQLEYGDNGDDGFSTSESFIGTFDGHFEKDKAIIDRANIDTSSFYE